MKVAAIQMRCTNDYEENIRLAMEKVREAAESGAKIILLQELFAGLYFCQEQDPKHFETAQNAENSDIIKRMSRLANELQVVLPISFFEICNNVFYNSIAVIDADGTVLGIYRKSHIPDGPGYQEKFYFTPGDTGFRVWSSRYAVIGVGICWDQWFPEAARIMALMGAEILFYPTAIGSEPQDPTINSMHHWRRVMVGHAASNLVPLVASNRIGHEAFNNTFIDFYGSSFICNHRGEILTQAEEPIEAVLIADLDLEQYRRDRYAWGVFRDRRPDLYGVLLTKDGKHRVDDNYMK